MYTEKSVFYVVDCNNDIKTVIHGFKYLVKCTYPYITTGSIGDSFKRQDYENQRYQHLKIEFIILDEKYKIVPIYVIKQAYVEPERTRWKHVFNDRKGCHWEYRKDPVPGRNRK